MQADPVEPQKRYQSRDLAFGLYKFLSVFVGYWRSIDGIEVQRSSGVDASGEFSFSIPFHRQLNRTCRLKLKFGHCCCCCRCGGGGGYSPLNPQVCGQRSQAAATGTRRRWKPTIATSYRGNAGGAHIPETVELNFIEISRRWICSEIFQNDFPIHKFHTSST